MPERMIPFECKACGKDFVLDGDMPIKESSCPHCGSKNVDHNAFRRPGAQGISLPASGRRMIVKVYSKIKNFHPLYFIGPQDESDTQPIGTITPKGLATMDKEQMLTEISQVEIIETYFRHKWLISDVRTSKYYELKILSV